MPFEKGHKKIGGRKKGTPNKFNSNIKSICEEHDVNPFAALCLMAKNPKSKHHFHAAKELAEYMGAKRRRHEFDEENVLGIVREIEALKKLSTAQLKKLIQEEMEKLDDGQTGSDDL